MIWKRSFSGKAWRNILIGAAVGTVLMPLAVWAILFFTVPEMIERRWDLFPMTAPFGAFLGGTWAGARLMPGRERFEGRSRTGLEDAAGGDSVARVTVERRSRQTVAVTDSGLDIGNGLGQRFAIEWREVEMIYPTATHFLMVARDPAAAHRIRRTLTERPPNPRARFVDFSLSTTGLQITRS